VAKSTSSRLTRKIYGMGRGWAFSVIDFSTFGTRSAIDVTLHRLLKKGTIRRVIRGIYDYPAYRFEELFAASTTTRLIARCFKPK